MQLHLGRRGAVELSAVELCELRSQGRKHPCSCIRVRIPTWIGSACELPAKRLVLDRYTLHQRLECASSNVAWAMREPKPFSRPSIHLPTYSPHHGFFSARLLFRQSGSNIMKSTCHCRHAWQILWTSFPCPPATSFPGISLIFPFREQEKAIACSLGSAAPFKPPGANRRAPY